MIEAEITSILIADTGVSALVGERVRPQEAAPTTFDNRPFVVYEVAEDPREYSISGVSELRSVIITYECWADDYDSAANVAEVVSDVLQGIIGSVGARYTVQGMFRERGPSAVALPDHKGAAQAIQGADMDWRVVYYDKGE